MTAEPVRLPAEAEQPNDVLERTLKAVLWVVEKYGPSEIKRIESLIRIEWDPLDVRTTVGHVLTHTAAYTYSLCLMKHGDIIEAGKLFRSKVIQEELLLRAQRVIETVLL